jgi:hypothetical protein
MAAAVASVARGFGRRGPAGFQTTVRQGEFASVLSVAESARQPLGIQGLRRGSDRRPRIYPLVTLFLTLLAPQNRTFLGELGALGMPPAQQAGAVKDRAKRFHFSTGRGPGPTVIRWARAAYASANSTRTAASLRTVASWFVSRRVAVASAPAAFRVRVWHLMSRRRGPRMGRARRRRVLMLAILPIALDTPQCSEKSDLMKASCATFDNDLRVTSSCPQSVTEDDHGEGQTQGKAASGSSRQGGFAGSPSTESAFQSHSALARS